MHTCTFRWKRKNNDEAVYKNGSTATNNSQGDVFTNMVYSKETDHVIIQDNRQLSIETYSNSGDSGYTDMHNEDTQEIDNDYYVIKENMVANSSELVDDPYYAIKDNVSSEYNIIAFKSEVIPDDQNYGHTNIPVKDSVTDETYDHAERSGTLLQTQSRDNVNEYSRLNERKPNIDHREMHNAVVKQGQVTSKTNESGDDSLTGNDYFVLEHSKNEPPEDSVEVVGHDYFVLEKGPSQSNNQGMATGTDAESHDYFVLSKEESAGDSNGNNSASKPKDGKADLKYDTHGEIQNDVNDHTYFENSLSTELEDDIHQYQGIEQRISNTEPENIANHGYFILEKKMNN